MEAPQQDPTDSRPHLGWREPSVCPTASNVTGIVFGSIVTIVTSTACGLPVPGFPLLILPAAADALSEIWISALLEVAEFVEDLGAGDRD